MNADGSGQRNLTRTRNALDQGAVWSPDGRKIAFMSTRDGNDFQIYVMNADGSGKRSLTPNPAEPFFLPSWSPDGRKIAFHVGYFDGIYVMNADGSGKRLLTRNGGGSAWSPDGRKIAFSGSDIGGDHGSDVYVMNADGSGRRNLTRRPVDYGGNDAHASPAWSPDGRKIAFDRGRGIFVMNADGSGQRQELTQFGRQPLWSPDGRMIAFRSSGADNVDIFVMNADGSGQRNLTRTPGADEFSFAWSPMRRDRLRKRQAKRIRDQGEPPFGRLSVVVREASFVVVLDNICAVNRAVSRSKAMRAPRSGR